MSGDLPRRALAAGFRWEAGVTAIPPSSPSRRWLVCWFLAGGEDYPARAGLYSLDSGKQWGLLYDDEEPDLCDGTWLPDFADAATLGVLLRQVREAWGEARISVAPSYGPHLSLAWAWVVPVRAGRLAPLVDIVAGTEAEALIAALEAAKEKTP